MPDIDIDNQKKYFCHTFHINLRKDARNPEFFRGKTLKTSPVRSVHAMRMQEQELEL